MVKDLKHKVLNKRITIQQVASDQDGYGESTNTWTDFSTVWASVEPINGRELFASQQVNSEITTRIRIRYLTGVASKMRVIYGSRILDILSVIDYKESHKDMQLMCKELI